MTDERMTRILEKAAAARAEKRAKRKVSQANAHPFPLTGSDVVYKVDMRKPNDPATASGTIVGLLRDSGANVFRVRIDTPRGVLRKTLRSIVSVDYTPPPGEPDALAIIADYLGYDSYMRDYKYITD